ncbi:MAG: hypothetical protein ACO3JL_01600 [Myxococcota bacterium]
MTSSPDPKERTVVPPATAAAPLRPLPVGPESAQRAAEQLALELEAERRALTLGGGLLCIPIAGAAAVGVSWFVGVPALWLPLCAIAGLAVGPALSTLAIAAASLVGRPLTRRIFLRRAMTLGLGEEQCAALWNTARTTLDDDARERLAPPATK